LQIYFDLKIAENIRENPLSVPIIDKKVTIGQSYYLETLSIVFPDPGNPLSPEFPIKNETAFALKNFAVINLFHEPLIF
jgi:hypothetical protein